jgi:hypothetical protein
VFYLLTSIYRFEFALKVMSRYFCEPMWSLFVASSNLLCIAKRVYYTLRVYNTYTFVNPFQYWNSALCISNCLSVAWNPFQVAVSTNFGSLFRMHFGVIDEFEQAGGNGCNGYNGGWPSARLFGWSAADWSRPATNKSISSEYIAM